MPESWRSFSSRTSIPNDGELQAALAVLDTHIDYDSATTRASQCLRCLVNVAATPLFVATLANFALVIFGAADSAPVSTM